MIVLDITTNLHESVFGMIVYGLLLEFSCLDFSSVLGVSSSILAFGLLAYIMIIAYVVYSKINYATSIPNKYENEK